MRLRHLRALMANDLRLHGRAVGLTNAGMLALIWLASRLRGDAEALSALIFNMNFLLALLWGDWLISREKLKGTFEWLRTLAVSDRDLVAAKFLSTATCCATLWVLTTLLFAPGYYLYGHRGTWIVLLLSLIAAGSLSAAVRWRFTQKLGVVVPGALVLVPLLLMIGARRRGWSFVHTLLAWWSQPAGKAVAAVILTSMIGLVFVLTDRWVRRSDTYRLLE